MVKKVNSSSQERIELGGVLPLDNPFSVHVFPSYFCNFKCCYCVHSLSDHEFSKLGLKKQKMDFNIFKKVVDGLEGFQHRLKLLNFAGHGEPLLNPDLAAMIAYAKEMNVSEKIELVTNAHNLTRSVSDSIIAAGLDSIRISIQGLTEKKYKEISKVNINYSKLLDQIHYFYEHKNNCTMYIKIIDFSIEDAQEELLFYKTFEQMCDYIAIEHMVPTAKGIDYEKLGKDYNETQQGYEYKEVYSCHMPFYMVIVEPDGEVRPCCATSFPISLGNIKDTTIFKIWGGSTLREFWKMQLEFGRRANPICINCTNPDYAVQQGDNIDKHREEILDRLI